MDLDAKATEKVAKTYEDLICEVFIDNPLKSAIIVDNEYPKFSDLADENKRKLYSNRENEAVTIANYFRSKKLICDIENDPAVIDHSRITNSDLIVLDYHLEDENPRHSLELIQNLSKNKNFNTVIVHTADTDLKKVWMEILISNVNIYEKISNLVGSIDKEQVVQREFDDRLSDNELEIQASTDDLLKIIYSKNFFKVNNELEQKYVNETGHKKRLMPLIDLKKFLSTHYQVHGDACRVKQAKSDADCHWILLENCFVVVCNKDATSKDPETQATEFLEELKKALISWNPNPIRLTATRIQNYIEDADFLTNNAKISSEYVEHGLMLFILELLNECKSNDKSPREAYRQFLLKISEAFGSFIVNNNALFEHLEQTAEALVGHYNSGDVVDEAAKNNVGVILRSIFDGSEILDEAHFHLNHFLNAEDFMGDHVTNGTILFSQNSFYIVSSPACDLVPQQSKSEVIPITLLEGRQEIRPDQKAPEEKRRSDLEVDRVKSATRGECIFIRHENKNRTIRLIDETTKQPKVKYGNLKNKDELIRSNDKIFVEIIFIKVESGDGRKNIKPVTENMEIIGQLKPQYADRFLQYVGSHSSRVGVDYFNKPN
ncbi:MAG TPA: hypothetical protein DCQ50_02460 [Chryseobacterium sp.]|nr:hypothetical protein [Chryseobacterium sp.]